jgi:hypothetical protein
LAVAVADEVLFAPEEFEPFEKQDLTLQAVSLDKICQPRIMLTSNFPSLRTSSNRMCRFFITSS